MRLGDGNHFGISAADITILEAILSPYKEKLTAVGLFGSRATGEFTTHSDIDLVLYGSISLSEVLRINTECLESSLSKSVDVCNYALVDAALQQHIDRVYKPLWAA